MVAGPPHSVNKHWLQTTSCCSDGNWWVVSDDWKRSLCNGDGVKGAACLVDFRVQFAKAERRLWMKQLFELIKLLTIKAKSKHEEPCDGRLSSTVPWEGRVKVPPPTRWRSNSEIYIKNALRACQPSFRNRAFPKSHGGELKIASKRMQCKYTCWLLSVSDLFKADVGRRQKTHIAQRL